MSESATTEELRFIPMPGKVVVEKLESGTYGRHIILPMSAMGRTTMGRVVEAYTSFKYPGEEHETKPMLNPGDVVLFGPHSGVEVEIEGKRWIILKEMEVLTKVEGLVWQTGSQILRA